MPISSVRTIPKHSDGRMVSAGCLCMGYCRPKAAFTLAEIGRSNTPAGRRMSTCKRAKLMELPRFPEIVRAGASLLVAPHIDEPTQRAVHIAHIGAAAAPFHEKPVETQ